MAPTTPRPYRDFMMPALHRRFVRAAFCTVLLCYGIAILMTGWHSIFWTLFPISFTGIRTFLLLIPAIVVYLMRVAHMHIGRRNTQTPMDTFWTHVLSRRTVGTLVAYLLSAAFFAEVCIWTKAGSAGLGITEQGKLYERSRLNERPIFLRFLFWTLAFGQTIRHVWADYDQIRPSLGASAQLEPEIQVFQRMVKLAPTAGITLVWTFFVGMFVYFLGFRQLLWEPYYSVMKNFVSVGKTSRPSGLNPLITIVSVFFLQGLLLLLLWEFTNATIDVFMALKPLKKGRPITADSSDPNGSLLNGLKSRKEDNRTSAFWELALITERFDDRRKTIYREHDRRKAPTWTQITTVCLSEIREIIHRIRRATDPNWQPEGETKQSSPAAPIQLVPRIVQPLKEGNIAGPAEPAVTRLQKFENIASDIVRKQSSPQNVQDSYARALVKKGEEKGREGVTEALSTWEQWKKGLARTPLGWLFRPSFKRTANMVVLGAPYSRQMMILNAITILVNLSVHSLKEDDGGCFQYEVPTIIGVFTSAIKSIESYLQGLEIHWSDFETLALPEERRTKVPEVEEVRNALKTGLEKILRSFNEYLENMGMSSKEIQEAKQVVRREEEGKKTHERVPEMVEKQKRRRD
ncbi:uncharacterized protein EI97DRAFT_428678 [Westerdykella ornata]|uniref:Nuclear envelope protein n=1 Tax=Westerdykella ornata TaxID=318751 RepID=A0A6A6JZT4_WESOR|nr:uncharacterized protein EI97DRAFT_428678 [Westerdykella ornata]KAF2280589.1 hypothetical protein EI97DRAFT_428678 [Westerdykella ornata]